MAVAGTPTPPPRCQSASLAAPGPHTPVAPRVRQSIVVRGAPRRRPPRAALAVPPTRATASPAQRGASGADVVSPTRPCAFPPRRAARAPVPRDVGWRGRNPTVASCPANDPPPRSRSRRAIGHDQHLATASQSRPQRLGVQAPAQFQGLALPTDHPFVRQQAAPAQRGRTLFVAIDHAGLQFVPLDAGFLRSLPAPTGTALAGLPSIQQQDGQLTGRAGRRRFHR